MALCRQYGLARLWRWFRHAGTRHGHGLALRHVPLSWARRAGMGAAAAFGRADLRHRLHLRWHARFCRPAAKRPARGFRLDPARLLVPGDSLAGRSHRRDVAGALPLCLPVGSGELPQPVCLCARNWPHPGARALGQLLRHRAAACAPGACWWCLAGADGGAERLWHRPVLRRRYLHDRYLPHLVRARRCRCGGSAFRGIVAVRRASTHPRAGLARWRALSSYFGSLPAAAKL